MIRVLEKYDKILDLSYKTVKKELQKLVGDNRRVLLRINDILSKVHEILLRPRLYHIILIYHEDKDQLVIYRLSSTHVVKARKYVDIILNVKVTGEVEAKVIDDEVADAIREGYVRKTVIGRNFFECTCEAYRYRGYCSDMVLALILYLYINSLRGRKISLEELPVTRMILDVIREA